MLTRIDHVGIACRDLDAKIAFYESTFGLTVVSTEVNEAQGVREAMLQVAAGPPGASYVQLLEPPGRTRPSASSWSGAARAFITWATGWRTSQRRWKPLARRESGSLTSARGTARWEPRLPFCTPLTSAEF